MISLTSPVETRAHRWRAGVKLSLLCAATLVLFWVRDPLAHLAFLLGLTALYALPGRVFFEIGLRRLWGLWPFVVLVLGWHVVTGDALDGAVIVMRMVTAVGLANLVTMTTRLSDMVAVLHWLATPLRALGIGTRPAEIAMALVVRFVPVLADKGRTLTFAWRARSARAPGWRVMLPFMVTAIDDAERVAEALRARGGL